MQSKLSLIGNISIIQVKMIKRYSVHNETYFVRQTAYFFNVFFHHFHSVVRFF